MSLSQNLSETLEQKADRMYMAFVLRSYELLLTRMLPQASVETIKEVAALAEKAMTEVPDLTMHAELKDKVYNLCPLSKENAISLHDTVCRFAPNIAGAIAHKGNDIIRGIYSGDDFFNEIPIGG